MDVFYNSMKILYLVFIQAVDDSVDGFESFWSAARIMNPISRQGYAESAFKN